MAKAFSVNDWFRSKGKGGRTRVKVPSGHSLTLDGIPAAFTDAGLAKLATAQEDDEIRVRAPRVVTKGGTAVSASDTFDKDDVADMLKACAGGAEDASAE